MPVSFPRAGTNRFGCLGTSYITLTPVLVFFSVAGSGRRFNIRHYNLELDGTIAVNQMCIDNKMFLQEDGRSIVLESGAGDGGKEQSVHMQR